MRAVRSVLGAVAVAGLVVAIATPAHAVDAAELTRQIEQQVDASLAGMPTAARPAPAPPAQVAPSPSPEPAPAPAAKATPAPTAGCRALPEGSGSGRRIVYSNPGQYVWLVESDGQPSGCWPVSGRKGTPGAGRYEVFSKSELAYAGHDGITMEWMVRFAHGSDLSIGFHAIPRNASGNPIQSDEQLGEYRSAGCVRQRDSDAKRLYDWAPVGTAVVVTY